MELQSYHTIYFLGIGGIGMSALARYFHSQGKKVSGYDKTPTPLTDELIAEGIAVHFEDASEHIPNAIQNSKEGVLVVYTPAIPADSIEWNWFRERGYPIHKRSAVLGAITAASTTIAVAGTHGKTTTSSLIAHILTHSGVGCNAFLGGIAANYNSNLLLDSESSITVVEADEFDRSFLTLTPHIAIITSMDADHLDIYGTADYVTESFNLFAQKTRNGGSIIYRQGLPLIKESLTNTHVHSYVLNDSADYRAKDIRIEHGAYYFTFQTPDLKIENLRLGLPGRHNVENAVAACTAALMAGVRPDQLAEALASFTGVKRRFETIIRREDLTYIDDYAHHPTELTACISSVRELFPGKKITGIFQPHLFTRTRDFMDEFARSLELLDEVILLPIYPARELPIPGIDSQSLLDKIKSPSKKLVEKSGLLNEVKSHRPQVLLTLGAGDIDTFVEPLRKML